MSAVGAADDVRPARGRGGDEVDVVGVELAGHDAQLLRKALEQVFAGAPRQLVHNLADRLVVEPRLSGERAPDRRLGHIKNDTSAPTITFSGDLWDRRTQVLTGDYNLHVKAEDGTAAAPRSGVKNLKILVDDVLVWDSGDRVCADGCASTLETDYLVSRATLGWVDGTHDITVLATDKLGHQGSSTFKPYWSVPDSHSQVVEAAGPGEADLGDASLETDSCAADGAEYCGELDSQNSLEQTTLSEPPLVDAPADSTGEPIATTASVNADAWGIADEQADIATDPDQNALGITQYRKITPWNIQTNFQGAEPCQTNDFVRFKGDMENWYNALKDRSGVKLVVSFRQNSCMTNKDERDQLQDPKVNYLPAINAFRTAHPKITRFTAWNEPNLSSEPFSGSSRAKQAGKLFNALWKACASPITDAAGTVLAPRCTVIAGDFSENGLTANYLTEYKKGAGLRGKSHAWSTHPYSTMQSMQRSGPYTAFLKATKGPVWLLESGAFYQRWKAVPVGSANDNTGSGQQFLSGYEPNTTRQFNRLKWTLNTLIPWRYNGQASRVTHFFYYQWADDGESFGTGLFRTASTTSRTSPAAPGQPYCLYYYRNRTAASRTTACG